MILGALGGFGIIEVARVEFDALLCGPVAVVLVAGVLALETEKKLPDIPMLAYLGDASDSTYLWHTLALAVTTKAASIWTCRRLPSQRQVSLQAY